MWKTEGEDKEKRWRAEQNEERHREAITGNERQNEDDRESERAKGEHR